MRYTRMPIEIESPEEMGYGNIKFNLTESSFRDMALKDLNPDLSQLLVSYNDHRGHLPLRKIIAQEHGLHENDVLLTVGAASALFIIATSILKAGDRILVVRPNYATNLETPRAIGAIVDCFDLTFEKGYRVDVEELVKRILPETKIVSVTNPHNPTGVMMTEKELRYLAEATAKKGCLLLVDETYRDMSFVDRPALGATFGEHVMSVSSLSKTYGLPGIRQGWLIIKNQKMMDLFLAAKEQIFITGSAIDEEIAWQLMKRRDEFHGPIMATIRDHFSVLKKWMQNEDRMEWVEPQGGVVAFPRIKASAKIDADRFHRTINEKYGTFVGPGHWFEQPKSNMRIGYGWPLKAELEEGLANISKALRD